MFCDQCGTQVGANQEFCHACGKRLLLPSVAVQPRPLPPQGSMAGHFRTLGILWLVISAFRLIPAMALLFAGRWMTGDMGTYPPWRFHHGFPFGPNFFVPGLLEGLGSVILVSAALGFLTGYGILEHRPWARTLAIVLAIFALLDFPFGTALGIYTLWVLLSARAEYEYRQWA